MMAGLRERAVALMQQLERYALYAAILSFPLQALTQIPSTSITLAKAAGAFLIVSVVARRLSERRPPFPRTGLESAIVLFALACVLSMPGSIDRAESLRAVRTLATYALVFYAVVHVAANEEVQRRVGVLTVLGAAASGLGAAAVAAGLPLQATVNTTLPHSNIPRLCVGLPDANEQALYFLFGLGFLLFGRKTPGGRRHWVLGGTALVAIGAGLALTMSRTGWVCALALLALRVFVEQRRVRYGAALLAALALGVLALGVVRPALFSQMTRRVLETTHTGDTSAASRVTHYTMVVGVAQEGGMFGHGLGATPGIAKTFRDPLGNTINATVHNVPLILWLDTGWFGLLAYAWLWSCIMAALVVAYRRTPTGESRSRLAAYGVVIATYFAMGLLMPFIYRSAFPILLACAIAATRKAASRDRLS